MNRVKFNTFKKRTKHLLPTIYSFQKWIGSNSTLSKNNYISLAINLWFLEMNRVKFNTFIKKEPHIFCHQCTLSRNVKSQIQHLKFWSSLCKEAPPLYIKITMQGSIPSCREYLLSKEHSFAKSLKL
jgi:hypothetical protein